MDYPKCHARLVCWSCGAEGNDDCDVCARGVLDGDRVCADHRLPSGHSITKYQEQPRFQRRKHLDRMDIYRDLARRAEARGDPAASEYKALAYGEAEKADALTAVINAADAAAGMTSDARRHLDGDA